MNEKLIQSLMDVGLNRYEAAVYVSLLERGDYAPASLATRARIPRQRIYDVLNSLEEKGFCTVKSTRPRLYGSVDPAVALKHHLGSKDRELHEELSRIESQITETIGALAPLYREGQRESDPFQYLDVLRTSNSIAKRSLELAAATTSFVCSFVKLPLILSSEQNITFIHEPLKRGIRYRTIYEESALLQPDVSELADACAELGQEIRVCSHLPIKMHAFDGKEALISLQDPVGGRPSFTALVIHHVGMVETLTIVFETLWATARDYSPRRKKT